jgi:hypothetical protein
VVLVDLVTQTPIRSTLLDGPHHLRHGARQTLIRTDHFGQAGCSAVHRVTLSEVPFAMKTAEKWSTADPKTTGYNDLSLFPGLRWTSALVASDLLNSAVTISPQFPGARGWSSAIRARPECGVGERPMRSARHA